MRRSILHVLSTSYSGSTLLGLLLDSQPSVRSLGEAIHLPQRSERARCLQCRVPAARCRLGQVVSSESFYGSLFRYYGCGTSVLVDTSKSLRNSLLYHRYEPEFCHQFVLLSKAPHEFAASWIGHHTSSTVDDAFRTYVSFYRAELEALWDDCGVTPNCVAAVTYRRLSTSPDPVIQTLCHFLAVPGTPISSCRWWETDSHLIGGNWLVNAQVVGFDSELRRASPRDQRRYHGREHAIAYDDGWRDDQSFLADCEAAYQNHRRQLNGLLDELGQPPIDRLLAEIRSINSATLAGC